MTTKRLRVAGARRVAGNASVSWLAMLVALGCAAYVFWIHTTTIDAGQGASVPARAPGETESTRSNATPAADKSNGVMVRLSRLEDRLPGAMAASEAAQSDAERLRQERDQLRQLYQNALQDSLQMTLHEVESLLTQANRALIGSTDFAAPVSLLGAARERVARAQMPQLIALARALDSDREALLKLSERSIVQAADQLHRLAAEVENLALPGDPRAQTSAGARADAEKTDDSFWKRVVKSSEALVSLPDQSDGQGFTPAAARFYLAENLRLRLLSARLSLLQHDRAGFEADRSFCVAWLNRHFDQSDQTVVAALATLAELEPLAGTPTDGSIQQSLEALQAARKHLPAQANRGRS